MGHSKTHLSKVFRKGQTVLPRSVRDELGIQEGDFIAWEVVSGEILGRRVEVKPITKDPLDKEEWGRLDEWVADQKSKGEATTYKNLEDAKKHSRHLLH